MLCTSGINISTVILQNVVVSYGGIVQIRGNFFPYMQELGPLPSWNLVPIPVVNPVPIGNPIPTVTSIP